MRLYSLRRQLVAGIAVCVLATPMALAPSIASAQSSAATATVNFDIAGGSLDAVLIAFATQSGRHLLYSQSVVQGLRSSGLKGRYTPDEAISRLLTDAPIAVERNQGSGFVLKRRLQPIAFQVQTDGSEAAGPPVEPTAPVTTQVEAVVVTGSQIRGISEIASPLVTVSLEDIDRSGRATVAEVLTELPQAFGGQGSPDTVLASSDRTGANMVASTGVNLRGLGVSSTLILVNGRRMAGTGLNGDYADLSAIPTAAVDRVEVLLDGASATYGSDAVGGVINVILKRDFDGAETRARLGGARGGASERQIAHTFGKSWSSGNVLASYEFYERDRLPSAARAFTADADHRGFGGLDRRLPYSHPGNILALSGSAFVPTWAIPAGQNGSGLTPSSFQRGVVNLENQRAGTDILPDQSRHSGYLAFNQGLGERLEISGDLRFSRRAFAFGLPGGVTVLSITRANPFFVSPDGASSQAIGYNFTDELGPLRSEGWSKNLAASLGGDLEIGRTWRATAYGAFAQETSRRYNPDRPNSYFLREALGSIADDPGTPFSAARDGYFNPYGDGGANNRTVLDFVGSGYYDSRFYSRVRTFNAQADGVLFALPAGEVRAAFGAQHRIERFQERSVFLTSTPTPSPLVYGPYQRSVSAAFAEFHVPIVGAANALSLVQRLELSLAGRVERYDVGTTRNPKVGVLWTPVSAVNLRATYGRSFRAPSLVEVFTAQTTAPSFLAFGSSNRLVALQAGGNTDLQPETAKAWTVGGDYTSRRWPGLRASATWFDTEFRNQIGAPVYSDLNNVLTNSAYRPFVRTLDPGSAADQAAVTRVLAGSGSEGLYPVSAYTAIVDGRNVNTGGLHVRGFDLSVRQRLDVADGSLDLAADVTRLLTYRRKLTPTSPWLSFLDQDGQPVDYRGRASATWTRAAWSAGASVNYTDNYATAQGVAIDSWTTVDAQLTWRAGAGGVADGITLSVSVRNVFDQDPPFYDASQGVAYDAANADPLGRFVAIQLAKRW